MTTQFKQSPEMALSPINLSTKIAMPKVWQELEKDGFHKDLLDRARAYLLWMTRRGNEREIKNAKIFLETLGEGFKTGFRKENFHLKENDPWIHLKEKAIKAIAELADFFENRVSTVVWDSFAHLAVREDPETKRSILSEANSLPHHYGIVDTQLHAAGKVYTFMMHVQSVFFKHTGRILVHNCDCSCSLTNLIEIDGNVKFTISDEAGIKEATQSLLTHQLAESHLLINDKLPFEFSITPEAREVLGVQVTN